MKRLILLIITILILSHQSAQAGIIINERRTPGSKSIPVSRPHKSSSVPLRWAPELKAWEDKGDLPLQGTVDPTKNIKERELL